MKRLILLCLVLFLVSPVIAEEQPPEPPSIEMNFPDEPSLKSFIENYKKDVLAEFQGEYDKAVQEDGIFNPWSLDVDGLITYRGKFWCMRIGGYDYRGGAHGMPFLDSFYFDAETKKQLVDDDLFLPGLYEKLCELCRADLIKQGFEADDDWMMRGTEPTASNYRVIVADKGGLIVLFNPYQVAPYAAGVPEVTIPWGTAWTLFKPSWRPE